jgi:xylitol oxidase
MELQIWAGNYTYSASHIHYPQTLNELREVVTRTKKLRVLGSRHSFNSIADSADELISLEKMNRVIDVDSTRRTMTVDGGAKYGDVCAALARAQFALPNLASLPHISVAGACATATHGSGVENKNLAASVSTMEIMTAHGEVIERSRDLNGDEFDGMVVGLGGFGVITKLTLDVIPTFSVQQDVYENLPFAQIADQFDTIAGSGYSVSLFTTWRDDGFNQVWLKRQVNDNALETHETFFGATRATTALHPIPGMSPESCTPQLGVPGPWHERLPHFRMEFTPSSGQELQSEYFVARENAPAALDALVRVRDQFASLVQISEVRTIAADDLWMSPCYQRASAAIHFTWVKDWAAVRAVLPLIEQQLAPFNARPHWGKLFTVSPLRVQSLYPKLPDFRALLQKYDPPRKFRNSFLDMYIFETE